MNIHKVFLTHLRLSKVGIEPTIFGVHSVTLPNAPTGQSSSKTKKVNIFFKIPNYLIVCCLINMTKRIELVVLIFLLNPCILYAYCMSISTLQTKLTREKSTIWRSCTKTARNALPRSQYKSRIASVRLRQIRGGCFATLASRSSFSELKDFRQGVATARARSRQRPPPRASRLPAAPERPPPHATLLPPPTRNEWTRVIAWLSLLNSDSTSD